MASLAYGLVLLAVALGAFAFGRWTQNSWRLQFQMTLSSTSPTNFNILNTLSDGTTELDASPSLVVTVNPTSLGTVAAGALPGNFVFTPAEGGSTSGTLEATDGAFFASQAIDLAGPVVPPAPTVTGIKFEFPE